MAIDGNPQMRVTLVIPQNKPDAATRADVTSCGLPPAYSIPQLRTGASYLRAVTAEGGWDEDLGQRGSRDRKLKTFRSHLLLKFIGEQNELVV